MSDASESTINPVTNDPANIPMADKKFDRGFKRNMLIIGGALVGAVLVIGLVVVGARSKLDTSKTSAVQTSIPSSQGISSSKPTELTAADEARLGRVQSAQSDAAQASKETYIPNELPLRSELRAPETNSGGPGRIGATAYYSDNANSNSSAIDAARESNIKKGVELQLASILQKFEAPASGTAGPYSAPAGAQQYAQSQASAASSAANAPAAAGAIAAAQEALIKGLKIAGGRLVSPLDTARSEFVSAEITSGPLTGAYLVGKGKLVGEEGVVMSFNRMSFGGEDYTVDVTALDNSTSSDSLDANIDRKLISRNVIPVVFATLQAYLMAVSRPAQTIVATSSASTEIVTPSAQGRQAAAAGIAAGIGKAGESLSGQKATAYVPVDRSIGLLFNSSVLKKVQR